MVFLVKILMFSIVNGLKVVELLLVVHRLEVLEVVFPVRIVIWRWMMKVDDDQSLPAADCDVVLMNVNGQSLEVVDVQGDRHDCLKMDCCLGHGRLKRDCCRHRRDESHDRLDCRYDCGRCCQPHRLMSRV